MENINKIARQLIKVCWSMLEINDLSAIKTENYVLSGYFWNKINDYFPKPQDI